MQQAKVNLNVFKTQPDVTSHKGFNLSRTDLGEVLLDEFVELSERRSFVELVFMFLK